jgi:hypothetical protein
LLNPATLGSISTAAGGFRYVAGVISIAEGKFHCLPLGRQYIYIHITALKELYRNLPQAAVEIEYR